MIVVGSWLVNVTVVKTDDKIIKILNVSGLCGVDWLLDIR